MIAFLRFLGILNAAVWLGGTVFFTFGAGPAAFSQEMKVLLGIKNYPYFSGAIAQMLMARYYDFQLVCAAVALLHVMAEWLYLGKILRRSWRALLAVLVALALLGGFWLQPKLREWHLVSHAVNVGPERREAEGRLFNAWQKAFQVVNLLTVAGLALYVWRVANPPDPARFVSAVKFRS